MSEPFTPQDGPKAPVSIFKNNYKKQESHPDYVADFVMTDTILKQIASLREQGKMAVLAIAGWARKTANGSGYISGSLQVDVYKTAKRYDMEIDQIKAMMGDSTPHRAPAKTSAATGDDDFLPDGPPDETPDDPFTDPDLGF